MYGNFNIISINATGNIAEKHTNLLKEICGR